MPSRKGRGPSPPRRFNSKLPKRRERYRIAVARATFFFVIPADAPRRAREPLPFGFGVGGSWWLLFYLATTGAITRARARGVDHERRTMTAQTI